MLDLTTQARAMLSSHPLIVRAPMHLASHFPLVAAGLRAAEQRQREADTAARFTSIPTRSTQQ